MQHCPFDPRYTNIDSGEGTKMRIHHLDDSLADGPLLPCFHGQPAWRYLYCTMILPLVRRGMRDIAPDLTG
ncbi:MAG: hypothetical protein HRT77_08650 [Halioglobus sp.]|nr:hypothetical protein [Halioglobus sp.]